MESQTSQDSLGGLMPAPNISRPVTPELSKATIPDSAIAAMQKLPSNREDGSELELSPSPSDQTPQTNRQKMRTPTPPVSHISTPPPTVEATARSQINRYGDTPYVHMLPEELLAASPEELRSKVTELQVALQDATTLAAHQKLQHQMLAQRSTAAIEGMEVEALMEQCQADFIAEQARAATMSPRPLQVQDGLIPVHKEHYQDMCRNIQQLTENNRYLEDECKQQQDYIARQDMKIESLSDKIDLMRARIRESRDHHLKTRKLDATPRSVYSTPQRGYAGNQGTIADILQASELTNQGSTGIGGRRGHNRNAQSLSSLQATPQRVQKYYPQAFQTPQGRQPPIKLPSTAPLPRTSATKLPDVYSQPSLPVGPVRLSQSEDTLTASESNEDDSEAETDIIDPDEIDESQASLTASQMLRATQDQQVKRDSFKGSGMLGGKARQTKLFGTIRKAGVDRDDEPPAKRARTGAPIGLGIAGVRD